MLVNHLTINKNRLAEKIETLAEIGKFGDTGVCRLALSKEYMLGIEQVKKWMDDIGLQTKVDHFGNLIGRYEGKEPQAPVLIIGSHIDSQPYGGKYDGAIGVLAGLEVLQTLIENKLVPEMPIEIVSFCDEEGFRFNKGLFGSRGITGKLDEGELERKDKDGITRRDALIECGCNPDKFSESVYPKDAIAAYLEMHIEQGPVLEAANAPIGIVTGIAGPLWLSIELTGVSGHVGSVPMGLRRDALVGASEIISSFNAIIMSNPEATTVGTVGNLEVFPNARSIIPEKVCFTIDLRDIDLNRRNQYELELRSIIKDVSNENGLKYVIKEEAKVEPKYCDENIMQIMRDESSAMNIKAPELMSGPFHDAIIMADVCEYGMIFVRSKDGISHNPLEYSSSEDISLGAELLLRTTIRMTNIQI